MKTDAELLTEWSTLVQDIKTLNRQMDEISRKMEFVNKAKADVVIELVGRGYQVGYKK